jgi:hypothetical protein
MSDLYDDLLTPLPPEHSRLERFLLVTLGIVLAYTALAYLVLPAFWTQMHNSASGNREILRCTTAHRSSMLRIAPE